MKNTLEVQYYSNDGSLKTMTRYFNYDWSNRINEYSYELPKSLERVPKSIRLIVENYKSDFTDYPFGFPLTSSYVSYCTSSFMYGSANINHQLGFNRKEFVSYYMSEDIASEAGVDGIYPSKITIIDFQLPSDFGGCADQTDEICHSYPAAKDLYIECFIHFAPFI